MALKTLTHPVSGKKFKMGRNRPLPGRPKLCFHDYLMKADLPVPPASEHYSYNSEKGLQQVLLNDRLGDCVVAGPLHLINLFQGNAGEDITMFADEQIVSLYEAVGGYDPTKTDAQGNNPTDQGCDEEAMLAYWQSTGLCGHKILGWMSVRPEDAKTCMWLTESLVFGLELPDQYVSPMPSHNNFVWDVAGEPDNQNGHCVVGVGYNQHGISVSTWGMVGLMTWAAIEKYASNPQGELYTVITDEIIVKATQKAANGFAWGDLVADFNALGGNVVLPA